jgi:hypothetical protein
MCAQLGLWVAAFCLTGCPVGGELEDFESYHPMYTTPVYDQSVSTTGATTGASTTGGAVACDVCDVTTAMTSCKGSVCHGDPASPPSTLVGGGLDLFTATRETDLVDAPATYKNVADPENCPATPELLINSANPAASLMITKMSGGYSCGTAMPQVGEITSADVQCITDWVTCLAGGAAAAAGLEAAQQTGIGGSSSF